MPMPPEPPRFSVVVPTYHRPDRLRACLGALARLDAPPGGFEVVVVDDGSPSPMESVVAPFRDGLGVTLLRQANAGPAAARNAGAAEARGAYLAFTDDDCMPAPSWLQALAARLADHPGDLIGGHAVNALPENPFSTASQQLIDYLYAYYNASGGARTFFASNNMAMPAERFRALGGFDVHFPLAAGEDRDFCDRWLAAGYGMTYAPEAVIHHAHRLDLRSFWRQHLNYGRGAFHFHQLRARRQETSIGPEPLAFYLNLLRFPLVQKAGVRRWFHAALLAASQVANVTGFFWEAARNRN